MKTCPYCAEEIKDAAIRCRWCLTWLVDEVPAGAETAPARAEEAAAAVATSIEPVPAETAMVETPTEQMQPVEPVVAPAAAGTMDLAAPSPEEAAAASAPEPAATTPEPSPAAEPAAAEPAPVAEPAQAAPEPKIEFTHTGTRYLLGYGTDYFGIWDRNAPQQAIERFPRDDQGWAAAWQRYSAIETNWMDLRTGQKSG